MLERNMLICYGSGGGGSGGGSGSSGTNGVPGSAQAAIANAQGAQQGATPGYTGGQAPGAGSSGPNGYYSTGDYAPAPTQNLIQPGLLTALFPTETGVINTIAGPQVISSDQSGLLANSPDGSGVAGFGGAPVAAPNPNAPPAGVGGPSGQPVSQPAVNGGSIVGGGQGGGTVANGGVVKIGGGRQTDFMNGFLGIGGSQKDAAFYDLSGTDSYQNQLNAMNQLYGSYQAQQAAIDPNAQAALQAYQDQLSQAAYYRGLEESRAIGDQYGPGGAGYAAMAQAVNQNRAAALADVAAKRLAQSQFEVGQQNQVGMNNTNNQASLLGKQADTWASMYKDAQIAEPSSTTGNKK